MPNKDKRKLEGFADLARLTPSLEQEFMRPGSKEIKAEPPVEHVLSCRNVAGGVIINGAFIAAGDRLAAADFLLGRGGFK